MPAGESMDMKLWLIWMVGAFLVGSIPFAVIIGKAKGVDIRVHGSGNPGASNLGRQCGKKWGIFCFLLDVGKGLVPTLNFMLLATSLHVHDLHRWEAAGYPEGFELRADPGILLYVQWVLVSDAVRRS